MKRADIAIAAALLAIGVTLTVASQAGATGPRWCREHPEAPPKVCPDHATTTTTVAPTTVATTVPAPTTTAGVSSPTPPSPSSSPLTTGGAGTPPARVLARELPATGPGFDAAFWMFVGGACVLVGFVLSMTRRRDDA